MPNKLRVLFVHSGRGKTILGESIRSQKLFEAISRAGFYALDVQVPRMTRDSLFTYDGLRNMLLNFFPTHKSAFSSFDYKSVLRQLGFNISLNFLTRIFQKLKPNLVLAETSILGWAASKAAKKLSIPCIVDVHGLAFAEARGWGRKNWQQLMSLEKEVFEKCDYLIIVSKKMREYLSKEFKIPNKKMIVAPNGSEVQESIAKYEIPLKVIYAGNFSYWEKVYDFLDMAKYADQKTFRFYLAGAGLMKNQLIEKIKKEKIPIKYLGYIPRQKIHMLLEKMQVGIAPSTKDLARQVASPIKVFDYMASGLPVVTPRIGDWGDIIEKEDSGIALSDDSIENYLKALDILTHENIWTIKSINAVKCVKEKYNWDKAFKPIMDLLLEFR